MSRRSHVNVRPWAGRLLLIVVVALASVASPTPRPAPAMPVDRPNLAPIAGPWRQLGPNLSNPVEVVVAPSEPRVLFLRDVTENALYRSVDRGDTWTKLGSDARFGSLLGVLPFDAERVLIAGQQAWQGQVVAVAATGGATPLNAEPIRLLLSGQGEVPVTITRLFSPAKTPGQLYLNVEASQGVERRAAIMRSVDSGQSWRIWRDDSRLFAIDPVDPTVAYARRDTAEQNFEFVSRGPVFKTNDGGGSWTATRDWGSAFAIDVVIDAQDHEFLYVLRLGQAIAAGSPGELPSMVLYFSSKAGEGDSWGSLTRLRSPSRTDVLDYWSIAVDPARNGGVAIAQRGDMIMYSPDQSRTWIDLRHEGKTNQTARVSFDSSGDYLYVAFGDGSIYQRAFQRTSPVVKLERCEPAPPSWRTPPPPHPLFRQPLQFIVAPSDENVVFRQDRETSHVSRSRDRGQSWNMLPFDGRGHTLLAVDPFDPDRLYLGTSADDQASFEKRGRVYLSVAGSLPAPLNGEPMIVAYWGSLARPIVESLFLYRERPDLMLAQTRVSGRDPVVALWASRDLGATWTIWLDNAQAPTINPRRPTTFYAYARGGESAPFWWKFSLTTDDGATWSAVGPSAGGLGSWWQVRVDPNDPDRVYLFTHNNTRPPGGNLYSSLDGGLTWRQSHLPHPFPSGGNPASSLAEVWPDPTLRGGVLAALPDGRIRWSPDGGTTWLDATVRPTLGGEAKIFGFDATGQYLHYQSPNYPEQRCRLGRPEPYANATIDRPAGAPAAETAGPRRAAVVGVPQPTDPAKWPTNPTAWAPTGLTGSVQRVVGFSDGRLLAWVKTTDGFDLRRRDQPEAEWRAINLPPAPYLAVVDPVEADRLYVASSQGVYRTAGAPITMDQPAQWQVALSTQWLVRSIAISPIDHHQVWVFLVDPTGVSRQRVMFSRDAGESWAILDESSVAAARCRGSDRGLVASPTELSRLLRFNWCEDVLPNRRVEESRDGGARWSDLLITNGSPQLAVIGQGESSKWLAVVIQGEMLSAGAWVSVSSDDSATWRTPISFPRWFTLNGLVVDPRQSGGLWVGVNRPATGGYPSQSWLGSSANGGQTWTNLGRADIGPINDIWLDAASGDLYVATDQALWRVMPSASLVDPQFGGDRETP